MKGMDRISQLPEPILEHILSFLVVKDAAKTSILSKALYNAWTSLSCLDFGNDYFHKFEDIIFQILESRKAQKISIRRFRLMLSNYYVTSEFVENMIKLLVACNIKDLYLASTLTPHGYTKLPEAIFAAKALNVLRLRGFELELLPSDGIKFSSLRELHLENPLLDEQFLQALFASCNDLEVLSLLDFNGLTSFQVAGTLPKLRRVILHPWSHQFQNVDIVAHNLRDLHIGFSSQDINVIEITACKSLENLHLFGASVTHKWVEQLFSCLPNLKSVYLVACASLKTMKISSDSLKNLGISYCNNLTLVDLSTPNLLRFSCQVCYEKERFSAFKLNSTAHLQKAVLNLIPEIFNTNWYSKLIESLGNFNNFRAIELICSHDEVIVIPKDIRKNLLPPLHRTKHLHVNFWRRIVSYSVVDLVDSLLWTSPQLNTLCFGETSVKTLKFIYRDEADEDVKPCCASLPLKCWRHKLEKVILQNFTSAELQNLRSYFLKEADILEIIEVPPNGSI